MLIANAFRDGVTRREIPYARYACRWKKFFTSTQLFQKNWNQLYANKSWLLSCVWFTATQQFVPNYTASSKLFQRGRNTIFFRYLVITGLHLSQERMLESDHGSGMYGIIPFPFPKCSAPGYIQGRPDHSATPTSYGYDQTPAPTGVLCCRIIAITVSICKRYRVQYMISLRPKEDRQ